jgi:hypothetical protein
MLRLTIGLVADVAFVDILSKKAISFNVARIVVAISVGVNNPELL